MSLSNREQLTAFIMLIVAILLLGLAPVAVAGILGKSLPDTLIAVSDKTVTGLVGVLGSIAAMIFRTNRVDEARADTTKAAFEAVTATAAASSAGPTGNPGDPVNVKEVRP